MTGANQCQHGQLARVCRTCEQDLEIAALKAKLAARPAQDCRTCSHYRVLHASCHYQPCINADRYDPLPPMRLWMRND